jgi:uncharacterized coiled-coil protein SlyX
MYVMNDDQFDDLKRFIDDRISQSELQLDRNLKKLDANIEQRFDEVQSAIAESISVTNDGNDEQLSDHEQRLTRLEQKVA